MALIAYVRVSTEDQSTGSQLLALKQAGCSRIFEEHASGGDRDRPVLAKVLASLKRGDTLVVARIDRLARSLFVAPASVPDSGLFGRFPAHSPA